MGTLDINMQKLSGYENVIKLKRGIKIVERFSYFFAATMDSIFLLFSLLHLHKEIA